MFRRRSKPHHSVTTDPIMVNEVDRRPLTQSPGHACKETEHGEESMCLSSDWNLPTLYSRMSSCLATLTDVFDMQAEKTEEGEEAMCPITGS